MKNKLLYFLAAISLSYLFNSCNDARLDIQPLNILTSDQVFANEDAITAYLASLYDAMLVEDFDFMATYPEGVANAFLGNSTDESIQNYTFQILNIGNGTNTPWWHYDYVRNVNDFIDKLSNAKLTDIKRNGIMGEAKFIRAFYYFQMVKRYGGVPIIDKVQNFTGNNLDELLVPRNTEKEVWDFVAADLDEAANLLPATNVNGRATKYAALALKSRAMLYAASVAKYGSVQLNGLAGIPASEANRYWQAAFDAANAVITSGKYSLYQNNPNKADNFQEVFMDQGTSSTEAIFVKYYLFGYKTHGWDKYNLPFGIRSPAGYSSHENPTLDCVEQFEYIDGSPGTLNIGTPSSPVFYNTPLDLFKNKDPRLFGSVMLPFASFKGSIIDIQAGLYDQGVKVEAGDWVTLYNPTTHQIDNLTGTIHIMGLSGLGGTEKTQTGFGMRKYLNPNLPQAQTSSSYQNWIVFRYAEVLLNYAEAAVELGNIPEAKAKINLIRSRAGIIALADADVTLDRVRHERLVELAFENHRYWDYRRWRKSDLLFNNWWPRMLKTYYDLQQNKYRFETGNAGRYSKTFDTKVYYERISPTELAKNPLLIQNPGY